MARGAVGGDGAAVEKAFGLSADTLMQMQAAHDVTRAREVAIEVQRVAA